MLLKVVCCLWVFFEHIKVSYDICPDTSNIEAAPKVKFSLVQSMLSASQTKGAISVLEIFKR